jgi:uncharacterized membrane protein required for colicin V production
MCADMSLPLGGILSSLPANDWVDVGCAAVALISIGVGAHRGFSAELPFGVGWFCGLLAAWQAYAPVHSFYQGLGFMRDQEDFLSFLSILSVVLLAWGVAALVSRGLRLLAARAEKTSADYVLGTVLGVIRAFLLLLVATTVMLGQSSWKSGREVFCEQSRTGRMFTPWASRLLVTIQKFHPHFELHRRADPGDLNNTRPPAK